MSLTYLTKEEKTRSLIYITNHELSNDETIQNKQFEMLEVLWKYYIKECDYYPYVKVYKTDKYNIVYTFDWPSKMHQEAELALMELDSLLSNFVYRNELYLEIHSTLHEELSKTYMPTKLQKDLVYNFTKLIENWYDLETDIYQRLYNDELKLNMIKEYILRTDCKVIL